MNSAGVTLFEAQGHWAAVNSKAEIRTGGRFDQAQSAEERATLDLRRDAWSCFGAKHFADHRSGRRGPGARRRDRQG